MLVTSLLGVLLQVALSPPTIRETVEYYDVTGSSAQELRQSIDRLRPKNGNDEPFDAFTAWEVRWQYRYELTDEGCTVSAFKTSVDIVMVIPRWSSPTADSALAERWKDYTQALADHERGHADIAVRAAHAIQQEASALPPASTCLDLETSIEKHAAQMLEQYRHEEVEYDMRTQHGSKDGAVFP